MVPKINRDICISMVLDLIIFKATFYKLEKLHTSIYTYKECKASTERFLSNSTNNYALLPIKQGKNA